VERVFRISIRSGSHLDIGIELEESRGKVLIKVSPEPGAPETQPLRPRIFADGEAVEGPVLDLLAGFRTIKVEAFGWEEASSTVYVGENTVQNLDMALKPAVFRILNTSLARPVFNPGNAGSLGMTEINFEVNAPGGGTLLVLDSRGELLFVRELGPFSTRSQSSSWNGRDRWGQILPDGIYSIILKLESIPWDNSSPVEETSTLQVELDSSREIRPFTFFSGKSGLLFAPGPGLLPPGSFQVEGGMLFGSPPNAGQPWKSLPFAAAFRFSPAARLEISTALNVLTIYDEGARTGFGGAVKWVFLNPAETNQFGFAAGASFAWTGKTSTGSSATPFGMGSGIELFIPLELAAGAFSFLLTPACIWTSDEGFPWDPAPRLLVSGGALYRWTYITAGLSARSEFNFIGRDPSVMMGGEVKFFPPPSSFVFSVMGGMWNKGDTLGGFGGISIGMIY
jgi:hypothetical protein